MLIVLGFYHRHPSLTWQQFSDHWRDVHGPLIAGTAAAQRYMRRYVQHHIRPESDFGDRLPLEFDGFSETWYDNAEARKLMREDPEWQRLVVPDDHRFLGMSRLRTMMYDAPVVQIGRGQVLDGPVPEQG
jgi:hypothetical protein